MTELGFVVLNVEHLLVIRGYVGSARVKGHVRRFLRGHPSIFVMFRPQFSKA